MAKELIGWLVVTDHEQRRLEHLGAGDVVAVRLLPGRYEVRGDVGADGYAVDDSLACRVDATTGPGDEEPATWHSVPYAHAVARRVLQWSGDGAHHELAPGFEAVAVKFVSHGTHCVTYRIRRRTP